VNRAALGNVGIDHQRVRRSSAADPFDVLAIYTLESGLIERVDSVRS
jgi:hypothetical protein